MPLKITVRIEVENGDDSCDEHEVFANAYQAAEWAASVINEMADEVNRTAKDKGIDRGHTKGGKTNVIL